MTLLINQPKIYTRDTTHLVPKTLKTFGIKFFLIPYLCFAFILVIETSLTEKSDREYLVHVLETETERPLDMCVSFTTQQKSMTFETLCSFLTYLKE